MRRRADFSSAVRSGTRAGAPALVVHYRPADEPVGSAPSVGFIVSRSVGGAVERNRTRRRLRHLVGARLAGLPAGSRLVIRANPAAATTPTPALAAQLDRALARVLGLPAGTVLVDPTVADVPVPAPRSDDSPGRVR
jgi:ribonuclease P protein component